MIVTIFIVLGPKILVLPPQDFEGFVRGPRVCRARIDSTTPPDLLGSSAVSRRQCLPVPDAVPHGSIAQRTVYGSPGGRVEFDRLREVLDSLTRGEG